MISFVGPLDLTDDLPSILMPQYCFIHTQNQGALTDRVTTQQAERKIDLKSVLQTLRQRPFRCSRCASYFFRYRRSAIQGVLRGTSFHATLHFDPR